MACIINIPTLPHVYLGFLFAVLCMICVVAFNYVVEEINFALNSSSVIYQSHQFLWYHFNLATFFLSANITKIKQDLSEFRIARLTLPCPSHKNLDIKL